MSELFWFTGLIVWIAAAMCGAYLLAYVAWCAVVAGDWMVWAIRTGRGKTRWCYAPFAFVRRWGYFILNGTTCTTWRNSGGAWDGFREWTVYPIPSQGTEE